jgi:hypothetical protein
MSCCKTSALLAETSKRYLASGALPDVGDQSGVFTVRRRIRLDLQRVKAVGCTAQRGLG